MPLNILNYEINYIKAKITLASIKSIIERTLLWKISSFYSMTSLSLTQISFTWKISIRNTKKQLNKLFMILLKINSTVVNFK
jgi:hypothetical protein